MNKWLILSIIGMGLLVFSREASAGGIRLLKRFESLKLTKYPDADGYSIGYGHFILPHENFDSGITKEKAEELLKSDVAKKTAFINNVVKADITQNMMDALVSLVYNIGEGNFSTSTLLRKLNEGKYFEASAEFAKWNKSKGKVNNVLTDRRMVERTLFETGLA